MLCAHISPILGAPDKNAESSNHSKGKWVEASRKVKEKVNESYRLLD